MSNDSIVQMHENSAKISSCLASIPLSAIRQVLPDRAILEACRDAEYSFRHRLIVPVVTVLHMILAAIWPEESFIGRMKTNWPLLSLTPFSRETY